MKITLWENEIPNYNPELETPNSMTFYKVQTGHPQPAVVIFPGGGYTNRCDTYEGEEVARYYNSKGFHAFVVDYRVLPHMFPCALQDAQRAVKLIKSRAKEYMVDANRIFVLGFSAGGHLAGCVATMEDYAKIGDELDEISPKPTGTILCYPVINAAIQYRHAVTFRNLSGHEYPLTAQEEELFSVDRHVTAQTPPTFIWHTAADRLVSVSNSLLYAQALAAHDVPFALHVYPAGGHGLATADSETNGELTGPVLLTRQWIPSALSWLQETL
jgi:acetyl esterase/lipase